MKGGPFSSVSGSAEDVFTIEGRKVFVRLDRGGGMGREESEGGRESAWRGLMRMGRARRERESGRLRVREGMVWLQVRADRRYGLVRSKDVQSIFSRHWERETNQKRTMARVLWSTLLEGC